MNGIFADMPSCMIYLDDLLVVTKGSFDDHLKALDEVFARCRAYDLQINAKKTDFFAKEMKYLGFIMSPEGIRAYPKKVEAIRQIAPPKTRNVQSFLGFVNYVRAVIPRLAEYSAVLSDLTSSKRPFKWTTVEQQAFDKIKKIIMETTLLMYPDFSLPFDIYTDASKYQIGSIIGQKRNGIFHSVAYFSKKMNSAQQNYTVGEKELPAIVETLRTFRTILLGQKIKIHTNHRNFTFEKYNNEPARRWRLYVEDYGPDMVYIPGERNSAADALSRLGGDFDFLKTQSETFEEIFDLNSTQLDVCPIDYRHLAQTQDIELTVEDKRSLRPRMFGDNRLWCTLQGKILVPTS